VKIEKNNFTLSSNCIIMVQGVVKGSYLIFPRELQTICFDYSVNILVFHVGMYACVTVKTLIACVSNPPLLAYTILHRRWDK
jgi:hypothetical protein